MATLVLQIAGSALGEFAGGSVGQAIGSAIGGIAGRMIDQQWLSPSPRPIEGPRLSNLDGISATEGAPVPRIYGRVRIGGQVIWATEFEEERLIEKSGSSGGKSLGGGASQKTTRYAYYANVAIALCEGPVSFLRRIWADGKPLDLAGLTMRFYDGRADQSPDPLIVAKQGRGDIPAFRGTAYLVLERFPLAAYGNRLPQFSFEVVRALGGVAAKLRAVNIIPGSSEFGYLPIEVREDFGFGNSRALNRAQWTHPTDWVASLDQVQAMAPALERVTLVSAWFGDDLRAEYCTLRPKVEKSAKVTIGAQWGAAGLTRETAEAVSATAERPNFGGSPSDESLIAAIRDLHARGLAVTLHPFILMDIPAANERTDPWTGSAAQPAFPWRGRISASPARGQPGSPEGSPALATQIAAFFGTASPADFTEVGESVSYTGPDEWSYRRMLLHHAMLARIAGGVETFYLGSELVGITHALDGSGNSPAVLQLKALAADVRAILGPQTRLTYAADWTEYGARVDQGGDAVHFPLDPLWSDPEIDAVAIDFYPPLTDWRAGRDHLDADLASSARDPALMRARITGGEAFDWFYANSTARAAQIRTPISDGAFGKPWIYRPKDLVNWWSQPHHPRSGGIEQTVPTGWIPGSKPIILAEIGCPAVDRGTNQPNVFPDPKSAENALPHFSNGGRDDDIQMRLIEAYLDHFDGGDAAANPVATLYSGRMVETASIAPWAWDARPFPAFPDLESLWSDGANWARGHWLNGRLEAVPVERLLSAIMTDFEHPAPLCSGVEHLVDGYVIDRPMSARAALEPILGAFGLQASIRSGAVSISGQPVRPEVTLHREDLVAGKDGLEITLRRRETTDLPRSIALGFVDGAREFRVGMVAATRDSAEARRELADQTALVLPRGLASHLVEARLHAQWAARETLSFMLRPGLVSIETGDRVRLETPEGWRQGIVTRLSDGPVREVELTSLDPALVFEQGIEHEPPPEPLQPAVPGAPFLRCLDLPHDRGASLLTVAMAAQPWSGPYTLSRVDDGGLLTSLAQVQSGARIGITLAALPPGPIWRWDHHGVIDLHLDDGGVNSLGEAAVLAGGNALALIAPDGEIELVLFQQAELVGERRYRLRTLLRGMGGSEAAAARLLAPGAECLLIDSSLVDLPLSQEMLGQDIALLATLPGRDAADAASIRQTVTVRGSGLRPLSPVHPRARREAGGIRIRFIRRARSGGDSFDLYEVPLGEEREDYSLEILEGGSIRRSFRLTTPECLYSDADEVADFGSSQNDLSLRIRQFSAAYGPGEVCTATIPVI